MSDALIVAGLLTMMVLLHRISRRGRLARGAETGHQRKDVRPQPMLERSNAATLDVEPLARISALPADSRRQAGGRG